MEDLSDVKRPDGDGRQQFDGQKYSEQLVHVKTVDKSNAFARLASQTTHRAFHSSLELVCVEMQSE